jgi:hypothetical protein
MQRFNEIIETYPVHKGWPKSRAPLSQRQIAKSATI